MEYNVVLYINIYIYTPNEGRGGSADIAAYLVAVFHWTTQMFSPSPKPGLFDIALEVPGVRWRAAHK